LTDPEKRKLYDMGGMEAVQNGGVRGGGGMGDIFDMFMGGQGNKQQSRKKRTQDCNFDLNVTLEDIYSGKTKKLQMERHKICIDCKGLGGEGAAKCDQCKGKGMVTKIYQLGPGMITQSTQHCDKCGGEGTVIPEGKKCKKCKAQKIIKVKEQVEVALGKGVPNNHKYTFNGMADEYPEHETGDVIVTIKEKEHKVFKRKQQDLAMTLKITLYEALCGFEREIQHLDGESHIIKSKKGEVIEPNSVKTILMMGLPLFNNPALHGNLFIHFEIEFPKTLNEQQLSKISEVLSSQRPKEITTNFDKEHSHECIPFDKSHINENTRQNKQAYDEDDDEDAYGGGGRGQRVNCQTQ